MFVPLGFSVYFGIFHTFIVIDCMQPSGFSIDSHGLLLYLLLSVEWLSIRYLTLGAFFIFNSLVQLVVSHCCYLLTCSDFQVPPLDTRPQMPFPLSPSRLSKIPQTLDREAFTTLVKLIALKIPAKQCAQLKRSLDSYMLICPVVDSKLT
jgi:hypothetical protein